MSQSESTIENASFATGVPITSARSSARSQRVRLSARLPLPLAIMNDPPPSRGWYNNETSTRSLGVTPLPKVQKQCRRSACAVVDRPSTAQSRQLFFQINRRDRPRLFWTACPNSRNNLLTRSESWPVRYFRHSWKFPIDAISWMTASGRLQISGSVRFRPEADLQHT